MVVNQSGHNPSEQAFIRQLVEGSRLSGQWMCVPYGPEAATCSMIVDPEEDEYRHKIVQSHLTC